MPHFLIILLKINLTVLLFAAVYYLLLRRLTFYKLNRIFLLFGILFSTLYPFIYLTDFFHSQQHIRGQIVDFAPGIALQATHLVHSGFTDKYWQLICILFFSGLSLMALRLTIQFISLYHIHKDSLPGTVANYPVRFLNIPVNPFSFWQTIYINPVLHDKKELQTILEHEKIHVKQWHSLDIILAELGLVCYWFNPGIWLIEKAIKENLEFITDAQVLKSGIDKKTYQYSLLDIGSLTPAAAIVNNFNLSDLKKRVKMMNTKRSSSLTLSRYLFVLPILLLSLAFTGPARQITLHLSPIKRVLSSSILNDVQPGIIRKKGTVTQIKPVPVNRSADTSSLSTVKSPENKSTLNLPESGQEILVAQEITIIKPVQTGVPALKPENLDLHIDMRSKALKPQNIAQPPGYIVVQGHPSGKSKPTSADNRLIPIVVQGHSSGRSKTADSTIVNQ